MRDRKILEIVPVGLGERNQSALELMLKGPGKGQYRLSTADSADIGIIDIDGADGMQTLENFRRGHPDLPVIALSIRNPGLVDVSFVSKPVRVDELLKALRLILDKGHLYASKTSRYEENTGARSGPGASASGDHSATGEYASRTRFNKSPVAGNITETTSPSAPRTPHLRATSLSPDRSTGESATADATPVIEDTILFDDKRPAYAASLALTEEHIERVCGSHLDIDIEDPTQLRKRIFTRERTLLNHLERAIQQAYSDKRPIEIRGIFKSLYVLHNGHIMVGLADRALRSVAVIPLDDASTSTQPITVDELRRRMKASPLEYHHEGIEAFLWKTALWTARGRLPENIDVGKRFALKRWPNLTRNELVPHAFAIASAFYNEPHTIADICFSLDIPQRYVFSFFSAADAVRILDDGQSVPTSQPHHEVSREKQSFLRRILGHIGS